jgi:hypothetical protein
MARDQPVAVGYGITADEDTRIARRWFFAGQGYPAVRESIDQMDTRPLFELVPPSDSGNEYANGYQHTIIPTGPGTAVSVFTHELKHPFLVDQQYDYYPTGRIAHNYVRIENDPVNMLDATPPSTEEEAMVEASNRIGSIRDGYHRKVEHIGGTPRMGLIYDLDQYGTQTITTIPFFPPVPVDPTAPERYFLRTTDSGYKHLIKGNAQANADPDPWPSPVASETKEMTGKKLIIWNRDHAQYKGTDGAKLSTSISGISDADRDEVKVSDIVSERDAALAAVHANLGTFLPDDGSNTYEYTIVHVPGQTIFQINTAATRITQYSSDFSTVASEFIMTKGGSIVIKNTETSLVTMTISGGVVDIT